MQDPQLRLKAIQNLAQVNMLLQETEGLLEHLNSPTTVGARSLLRESMRMALRASGQVLMSESDRQIVTSR